MKMNAVIYYMYGVLTISSFIVFGLFTSLNDFPNLKLYIYLRPTVWCLYTKDVDVFQSHYDKIFGKNLYILSLSINFRL